MKISLNVYFYAEDCRAQDVILECKNLIMIERFFILLLRVCSTGGV